MEKVPTSCNYILNRVSKELNLTPTPTLIFWHRKNSYAHLNKKIICITDTCKKDRLLLTWTICHELCHFKILGHSENFKELESKMLKLFKIKVEYEQKKPYPMALIHKGITWKLEKL